MPGSDPQIVHNVLKPVRCIGGQIAGLLRLVHHIIHLTSQLLHQIQRVCGILHNGRQFIREPGDPGRHAVDRINVFIGPVCGEICQVTDSPLDLPRPVGNSLHPLRDLVGSAAGIIIGPADQVSQHVQFIQQVANLALSVEQTPLRHQLSGNAAHILPAQNHPGIGAAVQISGLLPYDAANVIPLMGIPHRPGVDAALQDA